MKQLGGRIVSCSTLHRSFHMAKSSTADLDWEKIRIEWESDHSVSYAVLSKKYGVSKATLSRRAKSEGWEKKVSQADINKSALSLADAATSPDSETPKSLLKRKAANDEAAEKRAKVLVKHRDAHIRLDTLGSAAQQKFAHALRTNDKDDYWKAKIAADSYRCFVQAEAGKQGSERKAWGLDIPIDIEQMRQMSDEQLRAIVESGG